MGISLSQETETLLADRVKSGAYRSADEVVHAALRALDALEASEFDAEALDAIDSAEDQIERGEVHEWKDVREQVRARFLEKRFRMSGSHREILAAQALSDLSEIASYIRQDSPQNAVIVADEILKATDSLAFMPERFRQVGVSRGRGSTIYAMVVRPSIVYCRIEQQANAVYILSIRHGNRRQPRRFP